MANYTDTTFDPFPTLNMLGARTTDWVPDADLAAARSEVQVDHYGPSIGTQWQPEGFIPESREGTNYPSVSMAPIIIKGVGSVACRDAARRRRVVRPGKDGSTPRFFCPILDCNAHFTAKHNLEYHLEAHFGIKRYQCGDCDSRFPSRNNLRRHLKSSCKAGKSRAGAIASSSH
ncbi:hypothetical protein F5878DRAFT_624844 [Lentinula raphanica]|uniref:C2H2-type domain-containing protein n=1 Tax=Lentinula raphanica TaxID=153919 RepID=A0AA38P598_9AGAR|nr:hypothetical protein F5878DRAFT_624844 [Lentinula raphanica]